MDIYEGKGMLFTAHKYLFNTVGDILRHYEIESCNSFHDHVFFIAKK